MGRHFLRKGGQESSAIRTIKKHLGKKEILKVIEEVTGKTLEGMIKEKGILRQMGMELLCRTGGPKGPETGELFRVGYTSVSQERRRLRNRLSHNRDARRYSNNSWINVKIEELTPFLSFTLIKILWE